MNIINCFKNLCSYMGNSKKKEEDKIDTIENYHKYISYKLSKTDNTYECVICLEQMKNNEYITLTECFHMYHKNCLELWLKRNICPICPICDFKL